MTPAISWSLQARRGNVGNTSARMLPPAHQPLPLFFSRPYNEQRLAGIEGE
jgi:hypothetical protein